MTGLEPGTGFTRPRSIERSFDRVPKLAPGASQSFTLDYTILTDRASVADVARKIAAIQVGRSTQIIAKPEVAKE